MHFIDSTIVKLKRIPKGAVSALFFILVVVFLVYYLQSIDTAKLRDLRFDWPLFLFGSLLGLLFRYFGAYIWRVILRSLGVTSLPPYRITTDVYAKAWMGRYVPGTVTWIAGKVYMASSWGISKSRLTAASLLEGGSQVLAITFVSFLLLGFDPRLHVLSLAAKVSLVLLGLLTLVILIPAVFNRLMHMAYQTLRRQQTPAELRINGRSVVRSFVLYSIGAILSGASSFFVIWAIAPQLRFHDIWFIAGAFGLATVAGMAAPFAPSGLGVRDGLQLVLLTAILSRELALAATILVRLWSVGLDVLWVMITRPLFYGGVKAKE